MDGLIVTCQKWGARPPRREASMAPGRPDKIIFHHTAGHTPNFSAGETYAEGVAYARTIQRFHMDTNGWNDSGHNFLITRRGDIFEGRWGSVDAITRGRMIISAHCPGQNDQPGIEHEHLGAEQMTAEQTDASVWLHTWICQHTRIRPTEIYGHGTFFATSCPGELKPAVMAMRLLVARQLTKNPYSEIEQPMWRWILWSDRGRIPEERELANIPARVPASWWVRLARHRLGAKV